MRSLPKNCQHGQNAGQVFLHCARKTKPAAVHRLSQCGPLIHCRRCGAYSGARTELLRGDCVFPDHPTTVRNHKRVIQSLGERRHPRIGVLVALESEGPRPVHLIDEWRLLQEYQASRTVEVPHSPEEAQELFGGDPQMDSVPMQELPQLLPLRSSLQRRSKLAPSSRGIPRNPSRLHRQVSQRAIPALSSRCGQLRA